LWWVPSQSRLRSHRVWDCSASKGTPIATQMLVGLPRMSPNAPNTPKNNPQGAPNASQRHPKGTECCFRGGLSPAFAR
jgi:hypothetical protein